MEYPILERIVLERKGSSGRGPVPKSSNWFHFANLFELDKLGMDDFAIKMGLDDFAELDHGWGLGTYFENNRKKFVTALQRSTKKAEGMSATEIMKAIGSLTRLR